MLSKTSLATLAALSSVVTGLALPVTPVARNALAARDGTTISTNTDQCYWESTWAGGAVSWAIVLTRWNNDNRGTEEGDLKASLDHNGACRAYSAYKSIVTDNDTLAIAFTTADSCTAWQMTKVLGKTNGKAHGTINCNKYGDADGGPDLSNVIGDLPEMGDDGDDGFFRRRALSKEDAASVPQPDWADLKKKLGLPASASKEQVVKMLSGPSVFDELE